MKNTKKKNGAAKGKGRAALSAQQTIPYLSMHPDGVCKLPGGLYTKTVEYEDINYSVASTEDQTAIFSGWSSFLNYFDSSLPFQLSFINRRSHSRSRYQVNIPKADDNYNSVRDEFTGMLKNQIPLIYFAFLFHSTIDGGRIPVYSTFCSGSYYVAFSVDI